MTIRLHGKHLTARYVGFQAQLLGDYELCCLESRCVDDGHAIDEEDSKPSSKLIDTTPSAAGDTGVSTFPPPHPIRNMHDNKMLKVRIQKLLELTHAEFNVPDFHAEDHLISDQLIPKCDGIARVHTLQ